MEYCSTIESGFETVTPPSPRLPIAVLGLGAIGRMHVQRALASEHVQVVAVADPAPAAADFARTHGLRHFADVHALLQAARPAAAIVATPNATHAEVGIACLEAGVPVLVEKPVADTLANARALCAAAERCGLPLLVGHHRRHNPVLQRAQALVAAGAIGRPVCATAMATWLKPPAYFDLAWRRQPGGGPVLINAIHDVDLLRCLLGDVVQVHALTSNAVRGFEVEDTAAVLLRFANGALATLTVSDCVAAPWNWDLAAGEADHYPRQPVDALMLGGTEGSLTLPRLDLWRYEGAAQGWHEPLTRVATAPHRADPYAEQLRHLRAVVEGREAPRCSGREGLATLAATLAVHESARTGAPVSLTHSNVE